MAAESISAERSKGDVLVFPRRQQHSVFIDEEHGLSSSILYQEKQKIDNHPTIQVPSPKQQTLLFTWEGVSYHITASKKRKTLLNEVDGWVKPGTLTALMVSHLFYAITAIL